MINKENFKIILIICLISSLARFVFDSYLPSLPAIAKDFQSSGQATQFTLTLYLLGFSISQLIYGPLSDHYGRRVIILTGLSIFIVGNLLCVFSTSLSMLIFARLIAGVGAGACGVLNRAIASDCFKGTAFSKVWSFSTTTLVITLCIAPVMGGYVQEYFGWQANFIIATVYTTIVSLIILKSLPETNTTRTVDHRLTPDIREVLKNYAAILRVSSFVYGSICYTLSFSGLIAYFQVSPLLLMDNFGLTPSQYGWCTLLIALTYLVGGLIVNIGTSYLTTYYLLGLGSILLILGGGSLLIVTLMGYLNIVALLIPSAIYVIGARIVIPNALADSMQKVRHLNGSSSALLGALQMLGSCFISYLIANFNYDTPLPLAIFLVSLGSGTLIAHFIYGKLKPSIP